MINKGYKMIGSGSVLFWFFLVLLLFHSHDLCMSMITDNLTYLCSSHNRFFPFDCFCLHVFFSLFLCRFPSDFLCSLNLYINNYNNGILESLFLNAKVEKGPEKTENLIFLLYFYRLKIIIHFYLLYNMLKFLLLLQVNRY